jgi:hypothetical protein
MRLEKVSLSSKSNSPLRRVRMCEKSYIYSKYYSFHYGGVKDNNVATG